MIKVVIGEKEVKFNTNALFVLKYKNIFKQDVMKVLFPILKALAPLIGALQTLDSNNLKTEDLEILLPKLIESGEDLELLDFYKILYAMAISANKEIGDFEEWLGSFDEFPLFEIIAQVFPELVKSMGASVTPKKK